MDNKVTKYGVCYNLVNSPYKVLYGGHRFYFSSMPHAQKFERDVEKHKEWLEDSLTRRFKSRIICDILAIFQLYSRIETRGFYIESLEGHRYFSMGDICFTVEPHSSMEYR